MTDPPSPTLTARALIAREERQTRQAQALRDNLRRRKAQARVRGETPCGPERAAEAPALAAPPADGAPPLPGPGVAPCPAPGPLGGRDTASPAEARIDKP